MSTKREANQNNLATKLFWLASLIVHCEEHNLSYILLFENTQNQAVVPLCRLIMPIYFCAATSRFFADRELTRKRNT